MKQARDKLINTGAENIYFLLVLLLMTLVGLLYVSGLFPAYDPSILAMPKWLVFVEYLGLAIGGLIAFESFVFVDKLKVLRTQLLGLAIQTISTAAVVISSIAFGHFQAVFIAMFGILVFVMHFFRLRWLLRELNGVPIKRAVAGLIDEPLPKGDATLQALVFLQSRVRELEQQLKEATQ